MKVWNEMGIADGKDVSSHFFQDLIEEDLKLSNSSVSSLGILPKASVRKVSTEGIAEWRVKPKYATSTLALREYGGEHRDSEAVHKITFIATPNNERGKEQRQAETLEWKKRVRVLGRGNKNEAMKRFPSMISIGIPSLSFSFSRSSFLCSCFFVCFFSFCFFGCFLFKTELIQLFVLCSVTLVEEKDLILVRHTNKKQKVGIAERDAETRLGFGDMGGSVTQEQRIRFPADMQINNRGSHPVRRSYGNSWPSRGMGNNMELLATHFGIETVNAVVLGMVNQRGLEIGLSNSSAMGLVCMQYGLRQEHEAREMNDGGRRRSAVGGYEERRGNMQEIPCRKGKNRIFFRLLPYKTVSLGVFDVDQREPPFVLDVLVLVTTSTDRSVHHLQFRIAR